MGLPWDAVGDAGLTVPAIAGRPVRRHNLIPVRSDPAACAPLDDPDTVAKLLDGMRAAGAAEQAPLADRLPAAGLLVLFCGKRDRFRFGQEADGSPAGPWGWEDLD